MKTDRGREREGEIQSLDTGRWDEPRQKGGRREGWREQELTPAQTQEAFAYEAGSDLPGHRHVGLPRLGQDPAERRQEEEVEACRSHGAHALATRSGGEAEGAEEEDR